MRKEKKEGEQKKVPKNRDRTQKYLCVGKNFKDGVPIGGCGEVKSLMEWCKYLSRKNENELEEFFDSAYTNKDVVNYVYSSWGTRLEAVKKN